MSRRRTRRVMLLAGVVALALSACSGYQAPGDRLAWGVFVPDGDSPGGDLDAAIAVSDHDVDYVLRFAALDTPVPTEALTRIGDRGATPIVTLEPWRPSAGLRESDWDLESIVSGRHDADLARWAAGLAALHRPVLLRFAHEMNGNWYPWSAGLRQNTPREYVAAWRHAHAIFAAAHADRVRWVWAPNVPQPEVPDPTGYFPGSDVVDVLGIDGYNADSERAGWRSPASLFGRGLDELRGLPGGLPILVTETASAESAVPGHDKATWIHQLFSYLKGQPGVVGVVWFDDDKGHDWRFDSSPAAAAAIRHELASLRSRHRRRPRAGRIAPPRSDGVRPRGPGAGRPPGPRAPS